MIRAALSSAKRSLSAGSIALALAISLPVGSYADEASPAPVASPAVFRFPHFIQCPEADPFVDEVNQKLVTDGNKRIDAVDDSSKIALTLAMKERDLGEELVACAARLIHTSTDEQPHYKLADIAYMDAGVAYALAADMYGTMSMVGDAASRKGYQDDFVNWAHIAYVCFHNAQSQSEDDDNLRRVSQCILGLLKEVDEYAPNRRAEVTVYSGPP